MLPPPESTDLPSLLFAQAALSLSRTHRLVSSWLPPMTEAELRVASTPSDPEKDEEGVFMPSNELAGLGAKDTEEDVGANKVLRSDEKLKIQLLGRDWVKRQERRETAGSGMAAARQGSKPKSISTARRSPVDNESDDEGGRSSLGQAIGRNDRSEKGEGYEVAGDDKDASDMAIRGKMQESKRSAKRSVSYLDELLIQKARKEQRKQRRKNQRASSAAIEDSKSPAKP